METALPKPKTSTKFKRFQIVWKKSQLTGINGVLISLCRFWSCSACFWFKIVDFGVRTLLNNQNLKTKNNKMKVYSYLRLVWFWVLSFLFFSFWKLVLIFYFFNFKLNEEHHKWTVNENINLTSSIYPKYFWSLLNGDPPTIRLQLVVLIFPKWKKKSNI